MVKILEATQLHSKKGNPMLKLQLGVIPTRKIIWDYLVFVPEQGGKIGDFCNSAQLIMPEDDSVSFGMTPQHVTDRFVYVRTEIEDSAEYGPKAVVAQYLTREGAVAKAAAGAKFPTVTQTPLVLPVVKHSEDGNPDAEPDDLPF
jgi:hypothetical protein